MRLERALGEYFVGGIKTNISLFQRILEDPDFQAGKFDTGYLDRLLANGKQSTAEQAPAQAIAAIAAGLFAVLDPNSAHGKNGSAGVAASASSTWKQKGRAEALR